MRIGFGPFILDPDTRQLTRDGRPLHLSPKAFDLLETLALERPKLMTKAVLQQRLWPDTFVTEGNLTNLVAEIRDVLDDPPRDPVYIRTAHKFGYAFCGEAVVLPRARDPRAEQPVCWLEWGRQRFALPAGEHVVGRDPGVRIRLDASSVSRRHARLVVTPTGAVLEDFGSKNGTFRGDERVTSPIRLADGDEIRIGTELVTVRLRSDDDGLDTQTVDIDL